MIQLAESTNAKLNACWMSSAGESWTAVIQKKLIDPDNHLVCLAGTLPTIDPKASQSEIWSEDYSSEMEPIDSQEICGHGTISTGRVLEVSSVVRKKQCTIYKLPSELIGQILDNLDHGDVANFRGVNRVCASYGLQYLFKKGKARLSLCREMGYCMDTLVKKEVSWRIKGLKLCGDMKHESLELVQNPEGIPFLKDWGSVHTLHNLRSLELRLQPRREIPLSIHLAASNLVFHFLLHLLNMHRSPIRNLRIVHVGWWIRYKKDTTLMKAISKIQSFELVGHLDSPNYYGDVSSCLSSMNELRNLVIDFGMTSVNAPWDISHVCELTFDHLRSVHFSNLSTSEQKLLQFFEHHPKLQDVHIGTMLLVDGSWTRSIHVMARILPGVRNIKFSGLQIFMRDEGAYEECYICSNSINAYIRKFTWPRIGLKRRVGERRVTAEMLCQERSIREQKAAAGDLWAGDICGTCGFLYDFCTSLTQMD